MSLAVVDSGICFWGVQTAVPSVANQACLERQPRQMGGDEPAGQSGAACLHSYVVSQRALQSLTDSRASHRQVRDGMPDIFTLHLVELFDTQKFEASQRGRIDSLTGTQAQLPPIVDALFYQSHAHTVAMHRC